MNRRDFIQTIAATATLPLAAPGIITATPVDTSPSHRPIQPWYSQDGFGLFICWGISSVANIEIGWGIFEDAGKPNPYWPTTKYDALADQFNPQKYDPDLWMEAAARAGFKYCVFLTRHHDGYALWPSEFGDFGTKQKLNGRDLVKPYVDACRKHGLKVGFYYSPTDWHYNPPGWPHRGFPRRDGEMHHSHPERQGLPKWVDMPLPEVQKYLDQFYVYVKGQVGELLTRYGTIDLLWWDGYEWPDGINLHGEEMERYVRQLQPNIVENDRYFIWGPNKPFGDFNTDFEGKDPAKKPTGAWEQCETICGGWSYRGDPSCKPTSHIVERLVRNRAWGGNYLPDFGPRPDGTMSPKFYTACDELAGWMKYGAPSVFDVTPGPYPEQCDVPVTFKGNVWYVHFLSRKQQTVTLTGTRAPKSAKVLRTGQAAKWKEQGGHVLLALPSVPPTDFDEVVEVTW
ncbi:MAG: alpha-L-fucosidase [Acidobacteriota bacterium]|nr:alpha-L-fucosidase [Acidobacteriota bacterium]